MPSTFGHAFKPLDCFFSLKKTKNLKTYANESCSAQLIFGLGRPRLGRDVDKLELPKLGRGGCLES